MTVTPLPKATRMPLGKGATLCGGRSPCGTLSPACSLTSVAYVLASPQPGSRPGHNLCALGQLRHDKLAEDLQRPILLSLMAA